MEDRAAIRKLLLRSRREADAHMEAIRTADPLTYDLLHEELYRYILVKFLLTDEDRPENDVGICLSTEQAPVYAARYIAGGYRAQYDFRIIYRVLPSDDGDMLDAVEALTDVCAWCETTAPPDLGDAVNEKITRTSDVAVLAVYEDGTSDYGASLSLTWEVF